MKLKNYLSVIAVGVGAIAIFSGNSLAATISLSQFTQLLQKQAQEWLRRRILCGN